MLEHCCLRKIVIGVYGVWMIAHGAITEASIMPPGACKKALSNIKLEMDEAKVRVFSVSELVFELGRRPRHEELGDLASVVFMTVSGGDFNPFTTAAIVDELAAQNQVVVPKELAGGIESGISFAVVGKPENMARFISGVDAKLKGKSIQIGLSVLDIGAAPTNYLKWVTDIDYYPSFLDEDDQASLLDVQEAVTEKQQVVVFNLARSGNFFAAVPWAIFSKYEEQVQIEVRRLKFSSVEELFSKDEEWTRLKMELRNGQVHSAAQIGHANSGFVLMGLHTLGHLQKSAELIKPKHHKYSQLIDGIRNCARCAFVGFEALEVDDAKPVGTESATVEARPATRVQDQADLAGHYDSVVSTEKSLSELDVHTKAEPVEESKEAEAEPLANVPKSGKRVVVRLKVDDQLLKRVGEFRKPKTGGYDVFKAAFPSIHGTTDVAGEALRSMIAALPISEEKRQILMDDVFSLGIPASLASNFMHKLQPASAAKFILAMDKIGAAYKAAVSDINIDVDRLHTKELAKIMAKLLPERKKALSAYLGEDDGERGGEILAARSAAETTEKSEINESEVEILLERLIALGESTSQLRDEAEAVVEAESALNQSARGFVKALDQLSEDLDENGSIYNVVMEVGVSRKRKMLEAATVSVESGEAELRLRQQQWLKNKDKWERLVEAGIPAPPDPNSTVGKIMRALQAGAKEDLVVLDGKVVLPVELLRKSDLGSANQKKIERFVYALEKLAAGQLSVEYGSTKGFSLPENPKKGAYGDGDNKRRISYYQLKGDRYLVVFAAYRGTD
ncbi:MAG: hypothetical protein KDD59_10435, partial [Bdellovibrionales bacterium]|nr:hypothetical protein [Bdellovibrionales bacterium]